MQFNFGTILFYNYPVSFIATFLSTFLYWEEQLLESNDHLSNLRVYWYSMDQLNMNDWKKINMNLSCAFEVNKLSVVCECVLYNIFWKKNNLYCWNIICRKWYQCDVPSPLSR